MPNLRILAVIMILLTSAGCASSRKTMPDTVTFTGVLEKTGITTYMYGTHTISNGDKTYALRSDEIDLKGYIGRKITITGRKVAGYPVDGGPEYLEVITVK